MDGTGEVDFADASFDRTFSLTADDNPERAWESESNSSIIARGVLASIL